jgi:predicted ATPase
MHFAAMLHQCCRDGLQAHACASASGAIAAEHGLSFWQAGAGVLGGWALAATGSPDEGLALTRQGLRDWIATDSVTYQTYYLGLLAEVLRDCGQVAEAQRCIEEAFALVEQTGERLYEAELCRLRGELLPDRGQAEACFRQAFATARQQQARSLELRAAISLYRLLGAGPQQAEARTLLAETFGWFTEGFDTPDLQEAKELLDGTSAAQG